MIYYCVTISVQEDVFVNYLAFLKSTHAQEVQDTGCFDAHQIFLVHEHPNQIEVQYRTTTLNRYQEYIQKFSPTLCADMIARFGSKFTATRRVLMMEKG